MCSVTVIILLSCILQVHVKELVTKQTAGIHERLSNRLLKVKALGLRRADLETTIIAKGQLPLPPTTLSTYCGCDGWPTASRSLQDSDDGGGDDVGDLGGDPGSDFDFDGGGGSKFEEERDDTADTKPIQCSAIKKGGYCMLKGAPCKVIDMSTSKTGKHGHAKAHIVGLDIFNGNRKEDLCPTSHNIDVPQVTRKHYQLMYADYETGETSLLEEDGTKEDVKLPTFTDQGAEPSEEDKKVVADIKKCEDLGMIATVTLLCAMGKEKIIGVECTEEPKDDHSKDKRGY